MPVAVTQENIIHQLQSRNPLALSALIQLYSGPVFTLCSRILSGVGSSEDIEECVSDVFASAWRKTDEFDEVRGSLRTWLFVLTKYQSLEMRRKLIRDIEHRPTYDTANMQFDAPVNEWDKRPNTLHPDPVVTAVLSREQQQLLLELIKTMDVKLRDAFVRRYVLYASIDEITAELGLSRTAVDNRLSRARKWLKQALKDREFWGESADD